MRFSAPTHTHTFSYHSATMARTWLSRRSSTEASSGNGNDCPLCHSRTHPVTHTQTHTKRYKRDKVSQHTRGDDASLPKPTTSGSYVVKKTFFSCVTQHQQHRTPCIVFINNTVRARENFITFDNCNNKQAQPKGQHN